MGSVISLSVRLIIGGEHYNAASYKDAFARTLDKLKTATW